MIGFKCHSRTSWLTACAVFLFTAAATTGCTGSVGDSARTTPTTADASVVYTWQTPAGAQCSNATSVAWTAAPVQLEGGPGSTTTQTKIEQPVGTFFPSGSTCKLVESFGGLQPGTWTFSVSIGSSRDVALTAGSNFVDLTP